MTAPRTPRQEGFIRSLLSERPNVLAASLGTVDEFLSAHAATKQTASATITRLMALPRERRNSTHGPEPIAVAPVHVDPPEGVHFFDGRVIKVQQSAQGRRYAKVLVQSGDGWEFEYVGRGPLADLSEGTLLTLAQAAEFGHLYGVCACCGLLLTDEVSIVRGIGPVCERRIDPTVRRTAQDRRDAARQIAAAKDEQYGYDEGPSCSLCDALGHGYPGGPPCPLEDSGRYDDEPEWAR